MSWWLAVCVALPPQAAEIERALEGADFARAWMLAEALIEDVERAHWRAEVLYRAGDPAGALLAANEGLAQSPAHLPLLFRAAGAALWLEDPDASASYTERLSQVVREGERLTESERPAWQAAADDFTARSRDLTLRAQARDRAVERARWISVAGLAVWVALMLTAVGQGRSSRPVS